MPHRGLLERTTAAETKRLVAERLEPRLALDAAPLLISEFMAVNDNVLADEDGDFSDWIEIYNPTGAAVELGGWYLTDNAGELTKWTFPSQSLAPGQYLVVFASGKDRLGTGPAAEFHTNFRLDGDGEYVGLIAPDGVTVVSQSPSGGVDYPPQHADVAYGIGYAEPSTLLGMGAAVDVLVPRTEGDLPADWNTVEYLPEGDWMGGVTGVGHETAPSGPRPTGYWNFDDVADRSRALDSSGNRHHGTIVGGTYTADAAGHSGQAGDRALDFGAAGNAAHVNIADAASGAFDAATANDALTISLWVFGNASQPANGTVFYAAGVPGGSGTRVANAHLPWGDSTIYWDTGGYVPGTHRISRQDSNPAHWRGQWNHYVFVKDGDTKEIWQNGSLFHSGSNTADLPTIRDFVIGVGANRSSWGYGGLIDDFAVWGEALSGEQIGSLAEGVSPLALSGYPSLIGTDTAAAMIGNNASAYLRIPFELESPAAFDALQMQIKYDDGFVACLNGQEVARRNAPDATPWNAAATSDRRIEDALVFETIDLTAHAGELRPGTNVLAIQGLNDSIDGGDFLILPELLAATTHPQRYLTPATPGGQNVAGVVGFVADTTIGVSAGFFDAPFDVEIATETDGAEIRYTLDGSEPAATHGFVYGGPIRVSTTTTLRAVALKPDWKSSRMSTRTYLFLDDVIAQPAAPLGFPASWGSGPGVTASMPPLLADYEMDPDVVGAAPFTDAAGVAFDVVDALRAIPTMSLVMDVDDMFDLETGIHANARQKGYAWERAVSLEYLDPESGERFQVDAGLRAHGGWNRFPEMLKKSFRVYFRDEYGTGRLDFPLFPDSPVTSFDKLVLRSGNGQAWPSPWRSNARLSAVQYLRDQFLRDAQRDMGRLTAPGRFVHLYINGLYWGLYNLVERPDADFGEAHLGGDKEDYDVVKWHRQEGMTVVDGQRNAWDEMMTIARGGLASDAAYEAIRQYLDVESFIDYMIINLYSGNTDWPDSNAYALRKREPGGQFQFISWDAEETFAGIGVNRTTVSHGNTAGELYSRLRANAEFRLQFADRLQQHFFNGGAMTPAANDARWMSRATEIDRAIVAEAARWGDLLRSTPYTRDLEWLSEQNRLRRSYITTGSGNGRSRIVLNQFRAISLYPDTVAPSFNLHGGEVPQGFSLTMTAPAGKIYYTLDGSDPRLPGGAIRGTPYTGPVTIDESTVVKARVLDGNTWSALNVAEFLADGQLIASELVITELNYNPYDPTAAEREQGFLDGDDFEFVELRNLGSEPFELTGTRLTEGITFEFTEVSDGSPLLITEVGTGSTDYVEIQNVSGAAVDTSGWAVAVNNAAAGVDAVHSTLWSLPPSILPDEVLYRTDDPDDNYWEGDIAWKTRGDGWVMVVDGQGNLADFVAWGYDAAEMAALRVSVNGFDVDVGKAWSGPAAVANSGASQSLQRGGTVDHDDASDFVFTRPTSPGEQNDGLTTPFASSPVVLRPGESLVVAQNVAAFHARYGDNVEVVGQYAGRLSNTGERVTLVDPSGWTILDFRYSDSGSWPDRADGRGASLELIDPTASLHAEVGQTAYLEDGQHWRASSEYGGSPGRAGEGPRAVVIGRYVFYNNSAFDRPESGLTDDDAVATDKEALLPGATATFANYTSYVRGINGVMVDVAGLPAMPTVDDFEFRTGNSNDPSVWATAPAPRNIGVRSGAGIGGSDRVTIVWDDNAVAGQWLQVRMRATTNTGLAADDVFYFGNAIGEAGNSVLNAIVNTTDRIAARNFQHGPTNLAAIDDPYDYNRDRLVNTTDGTITRTNQTGPTDALRLIAVPAAEAVFDEAIEHASPDRVPWAGDLDWLREAIALSAMNESTDESNRAGEAVDALTVALNELGAIRV